MNDLEIIEGIKNARIDAQKALYVQNRDTCVGVLNKLNNYDTATSEDIYQEAYVKLWEKIVHDEFSLTGTLKAWLVKTCTYMQYNLFDKKKPDPQVIEDAETPFDVLLQNEESEKKTNQEIFYLKAFMKMKDDDTKCYKILYLFYFARKNMNEIAISLGYKNGNHAKNEKYRCLNKLRLSQNK